MNIITTWRKAFALAVILPFMLLIAAVRTCAAAPAVNIAVREDVRAGNEFTVTVSFSSDKEIGMVSAALAYSRSEIEFISSDHADGGGGGIVNISGSPAAGSDKMDILLRFRAISGGKSEISVTNGTILSPDGTVVTGSLSAAAPISVSGETRPPEPKESTISETETSALPDSSSEEESSAAEESSSEAESSSLIDDGGLARLISLTVSADDAAAESGSKPEQFKLKPEFSPDIFEYEVTVHNDTEYISVDAELKDKLDTIWYDGSVYLAVGMTPWTITVTTPDNAVSHVYFIRVIRHEEGYVEESSEEESSSQEESSVVTVPASEIKTSNKADPPKIPSEAEPHQQDERPLREKLMPILLTAVCVIGAAVLFIVFRIHKKSKNKFGQPK